MCTQEDVTQRTQMATVTTELGLDWTARVIIVKQMQMFESLISMD